MSRTGEVGRWLVRKGMEGERQRGKGHRDGQTAKWPWPRDGT